MGGVVGEHSVGPRLGVDPVAGFPSPALMFIHGFP